MSSCQRRLTYGASSAAHVAGYIANEKFHQVSGGGLAGALLLSGRERLKQLGFDLDLRPVLL
jgi:hypothetical protein